MKILAGAGTSMPLAEVAVAAELPKSTVRRLLATLESVGAVRRGAEPGTYVAGALVATGPGDPTIGLHAVAPVFVRDAMQSTGEASTVAVLDQGSVIFTEQVNGPNPITVPASTGIRFVPHTLSSGLALMSGWSDDAISLHLRSHRDVDAEDVWAKVASARSHGYLWHVDRWIDGISAVAAPVRDGSGRVIAALGSFGPSYRFPGQRDGDEIGDMLVTTARALAAHL